MKERIKAMVKDLLEAGIREEQELYLEKHPTKANGYYTRDLLTLTGPVEDFRVPRVQEGDFHPKILPYCRRTSVELSEAILALLRLRREYQKHTRFLESVYGAFYSPQSVSHLTKVIEDEVRAWREKPLCEEYYAIFLDGTFLSVRRGKTAKEPVYIGMGIKLDGRREVLGFWLFGAEGESARNWEEVLKDLRRRGVQKATSLLPGAYPLLEKITS